MKQHGVFAFLSDFLDIRVFKTKLGKLNVAVKFCTQFSR